MKLAKLLLLTSALSIGLMTSGYAATTSTKATVNSTDIGVLATIATIDKNEILLGVIATNKKVSSGVGHFANMMIDQHGTNLTEALEMANNLHINALTGGDSDKLATQGKNAMLALGGLNGDQFDKAYVDAMVKGHTAALDLIDNHLLKSAKNDDVKNFLTATRATVVIHLDHAKKLQEKM